MANKKKKKKKKKKQKVVVEKVALDSPEVRARVAAQLGVSESAVALVLKGRLVAATVGKADRLGRARDAVDGALNSDQPLPRGGAIEVLAEIDFARHRRRVDQLLESLAQAEVDAKLRPDRLAIIVSGQTAPIPGPGAGWNHESLLRSLARGALADHFLTRVREHLSGFPLRAVATDDGVALVSPLRVVSRLSATRAVVLPPRNSRRARDEIGGNFLARGPHWDRLVDALRRVLPAAPRSGAVPGTSGPRRVITQLSAAVSADLHELAVIASQLIREERTIAFAHAVELRMADESVRFEPIRNEGASLEVPFAYRTPGGTVQAAIRLKTPADPLAIAVAHADADGLIERGWVTALVAFADLTCVPQQERTRGEPAPRAPRSLRGSSRRPAAVRHGKTHLAASFAPSGETGELLAAYVAGHRRRLRDGHTPSREAVEAAARASITLRERETWVRPHVRGAPDDVVLTFSWTPPALLVTAS